MIQVIGVDHIVGGMDAIERNLSPARMTERFVKVNEALTAYHRTTYGKGRQDLPQTLERHPDSNGRLVESGKLRASLTRDDAEGAVRVATPSGSVWGTSIWYGSFAQYGTPNERKRPLVRFNTATKLLIRETIERNLYRGAEEVLSDD